MPISAKCELMLGDLLYLLDLLSELTSGSKDKGLAVTDGEVKALENTNGESGSLTSTRLGLGNDIQSLNQRQDSTGLHTHKLISYHNTIPHKC